MTANHYNTSNKEQTMNQCRCDEAERTRQRLHHPRPSDPPPNLPMTERSVDGEVTCAYCWELIG